LYDLTPFLHVGGDNVLAVSVDHSRQWDARWYTGSGIYRPVWLVSAPPTHLALWGTAWQLRDVSRTKADIDVTAQVRHTQVRTTDALTIDALLLDAEGRQVATSKPQTITSDTVYALRLPLAKPRRWALDDPYLYRLRVRLLARDGSEVDATDVPLGVRTLRFDADRGFALNDVKDAMSGMLKPKYKEVIQGRVEIRQVMKFSKALVAGSYVLEGKICNNSKIRIIRDNIEVFDGEIDSLRRFKDEVKEVAAGYECGISIVDFRDFREGDIIEPYTMEEIETSITEANKAAAKRREEEQQAKEDNGTEQDA
ncbi:MAG: hypothetical protein II687_08370, partial [Selenomonadaceae bacterium]|nr:hypothetical protein [Selenomonadaceae bacterium]